MYKRMYARDATFYPGTMEIAVFNYPTKSTERVQGKGVRAQIFKVDERRLKLFRSACMTLAPSAIPYLHDDGPSIMFSFGGR